MGGPGGWGEVGGKSGWKGGMKVPGICICACARWGQGRAQCTPPPPPHGFWGRPFWVLGVSCSYFCEGSVFI